MSFYLYILRHAKSDWSTGTSDFERPLNKRGEKNAKLMGRWMADNNHIPELVVSSPAERAKHTSNIVNKQLKKVDGVKIIYEPDLYLADVGTLLDKINLHKYGHHSLMLVAHNPGLDYLVMQLSNNGLSADASGKLMTTAALAIFEYADEEFDPEIDRPESMALYRPKELE